MNKNSRNRLRRNNTKNSGRKIRDGVFEISRNEKRNTCMLVYHNVGENKRCSSVTRHEAIDTDRVYRGVRRARPTDNADKPRRRRRNKED